MLHITPKSYMIRNDDKVLAELTIICNSHGMIMELRFRPVGDNISGKILEWTEIVLEKNNHNVYTFNPTMDGLEYHFLSPEDYHVNADVLNGYYSVVVAFVVPDINDED